MNIRRTARRPIANPPRPEKSEEQTKVNLEESWQTSNATFDSTADLLASTNDYVDTHARYEYQTSRESLENPTEVRIANAIGGGLGLSAVGVGVGSALGLSWELIGAGADLTAKIGSIYPVDSIPSPTIATLATIGGGLGLAAGVVVGALSDPKHIETKGFTGILNKSEDGTRFSILKEGREGRVTSFVERTVDLTKEPIVDFEPVAANDDSLPHILKKMAVGAVSGLAVSAGSGNHIFNTMGLGAVTAAVSSAPLGAYTAKEGDSRVMGALSASASAIPAGLASGAAAGIAKHMVGAGPVGQVLVGAAAAGALVGLAPWG